jgi:hypothetical protein
MTGLSPCLVRRLRRPRRATHRERAATRGRIPIHRFLASIQVARGLAAAHEKEIGDHDLKLENILVARDGRGDSQRYRLTELCYAGINSRMTAGPLPRLEACRAGEVRALPQIWLRHRTGV